MSKEQAIIMSGNHPKLILEGKKTMTRRVLTRDNSLPLGDRFSAESWAKLDFEGKTVNSEFPLSYWHELEETKWLEIGHGAPPPFADGKPETGQYLHVPYEWEEDMKIFRIYPRWEVGNRLWVKEKHYLYSTKQTPSGVIYFADVGPSEQKKAVWRSSIFMPRWASRILLEITGIRAERLQEITDEDCYKEGCQRIYKNEALDWYKNLWDSLYAKQSYSWVENPWVWVIEFKAIEAGISVFLKDNLVKALPPTIPFYVPFLETPTKGEIQMIFRQEIPK